MSGAPPITTDDLLDEAEERTGLARGQLVRMVAKSATIRYIAGDPTQSKRFVLKGGSLLTHVYQSPRQSIADADYAHLDRTTVKVPDLNAAFTGHRDGLTLSAEFRYLAPKGFEGTATYELSGIDIRPSSRSRQLKISISVRAGEWLDPPAEELIYDDPLLADERSFRVQGLSREELAAEKVLAWASKDLAKHLVDIAYLRREWGDSLDYERIADLVRRKLAKEKTEARYKSQGISRAADLTARFCRKDRLADHLHKDYDRRIEDELLFLAQERSGPGTDSLLVASNVERLAFEFWGELEPLL